MTAVDDGKKLAEAWSASGMFGKSPEEAAATRLGCSKGERCTLCGGPAAFKVEEDTFGEHRHPYTAYVCADDFSRIMFPHEHRDAAPANLIPHAVPALVELKRMLDTLQQSADVGLFDLGRYQCEKRLSNGYAVTFEVCEPTQARCEEPEVVCPACSHRFFTDNDDVQVDEVVECPECRKALVCQQRTVLLTWGVFDTEPPPAEKTNPVASSSPPLALDEDEEDHLG
jgi:hypothetical protein